MLYRKRYLEKRGTYYEKKNCQKNYNGDAYGNYGCRYVSRLWGKRHGNRTVNTEVSTQKEVTANEVTAEKSVTMIQNTANELSAVIREIQTAKNHSFEKVVLTYQNESVTITEKLISDHKTNKKLVVTKTEKKKEFFKRTGSSTGIVDIQRGNEIGTATQN